MKMNKKIIAALGAAMLIAPSAALMPASTQTVQAAKTHNIYKHLPPYVVYTKQLGKGRNAIKPGSILSTGLYTYDYSYGKTHDWYGDYIDFIFIRIPKDHTKGFKSSKAALRYSKKHFPKYWYSFKHPDLSAKNKAIWNLNGAYNLVRPDDFKNQKPLFDPKNPDYNPDAPYEN